MKEETVKNTKIKQMLVDQVGWVYSQFGDNQVGGSGYEPIEVFTINREIVYEN